MDNAVLVKSQTQDGWKLLEELNAKQFPMKAAYWKYLPEAETWRLIIASDLVDEPGSIDAYSKLQTLLNELPSDLSEEFSVANITLLSPYAEQIKKIKTRYGEMPLNKALIRRVSLSPDEAYIYFME